MPPPAESAGLRCLGSYSTTDGPRPLSTHRVPGASPMHQPSDPSPESTRLPSMSRRQLLALAGGAVVVTACGGGWLVHAVDVDVDHDVGAVDNRRAAHHDHEGVDDDHDHHHHHDDGGADDDAAAAGPAADRPAARRPGAAGRVALVVKVSNDPGARPQTGLNEPTSSSRRGARARPASPRSGTAATTTSSGRSARAASRTSTWSARSTARCSPAPAATRATSPCSATPTCCWSPRAKGPAGSSTRTAVDRTRRMPTRPCCAPTPGPSAPRRLQQYPYRARRRGGDGRRADDRVRPADAAGVRGLALRPGVRHLPARRRPADRTCWPTARRSRPRT